jgi:hypothetical protein
MERALAWLFAILRNGGGSDSGARLSLVSEAVVAGLSETLRDVFQLLGNAS